MNTIRKRPTERMKRLVKSDVSKVLLPASEKKLIKQLPEPLQPLLLNESKLVAGPFWNIWDSGNKYKVRVSAPGLSKRNIKVYTNGNKLTISCAKDTISVDNTKVYVLKEFDFNSWSRTIALPNKIDPAGIKMRYKDGIVKLELTKLENGLNKSK